MRKGPLLPPTRGLLAAALTAGALACTRPGDTPAGGGRAGDAVVLDAAAAGAAALSALEGDSAWILEGLHHLSSDSLEGRGTGTPGAALARAWLETQMAAAGVRPLGDGWERAFTWTRGAETTPRTGVNVVGARPGESGKPWIVVSAHYDHLGVRDGEIFNGADDDASGSVALVALARALRGVSLRHPLVVVAFDAEEVGLQGARAFVSDPPVPLDSIALDLNLDMVARTGGVLWAAGAHHTPALRPVLEEVAAGAPLTLRLGHDAPGVPGQEDWTRSSDHGPFHEAGVPFVYLGVEDHPDYHRPTDDFENIDPREYMDALRTALMTLLALDAALPLAGDVSGPSDTTPVAPASAPGGQP